MNDRLCDFEGKYPLLNCSYRDLSACVSYWINHQKSRECINHQQAMIVAVAWWVRGPLWSICTVRKGIVSPCHSSSGTSFLCFGCGLLFWQIRQSAVRAQIQSTYRASKKTFSVSIGLCRSHMTTHFIVVSKSETSQKWLKREAYTKIFFVQFI